MFLSLSLSLFFSPSSLPLSHSSESIFNFFKYPIQMKKKNGDDCFNKCLTNCSIDNVYRKLKKAFGQLKSEFKHNH